MTAPVVIVGTGLAGYTLARELRRLDGAVPLVMLSADDGAFYSKPMLSNALAQGKGPGALVMQDAGAMAQTLGADIRARTRVERVDPDSRSLRLSGGGELGYGTLVLALGARPIRPPMEGTAADRVLSVNNLHDYGRFREALEKARSVAVIGPGLIGCEFANDLLSQGRMVSVIGPDPYPLSTLLPRPAGEALQGALGEAGVSWHLGRTVARVDGDDSALRLELDDGSSLDADLVLSAVGLRPETALAEAAGLKVARGILTDRLLRTSAPDVYALGDCAEVEGLVLPFVMPIMHAARALAKTLAGEPTPVSYPAMPVVVKTPAHPVAVAPPPRGAEGEWETEVRDGGVRALFRAPDGRLLGFALTGEATSAKQALTRDLPPVLD